MNFLAIAYKSFFKEIKAQYAPFGYSDVWSELGYDGAGGGGGITTSGPLSRLDLDMPERVQPWSQHSLDFQQEWGSHKGNRAWGSDFFISKKMCSRCNGKKYKVKNKKKKKCKKCKGHGYMYVKYRYSKTNPQLDGRLKQQKRYDGKAYWPHNRDVIRTPREEATSWTEWSQKEMLGKPY